MKGGSDENLIENNKMEKIVKYSIIGLSCLLIYKLFVNYKKKKK